MKASRRQVLAGAGAVLAGSAAFPGTSASPAGNTVVLQDGRHALPDVVLRQFAGNGALLMQLEPDPVRQWRGEYAALLAARGTRLLGATRWPEFLLVRGLAEESGRRVRYQKVDAASAAIIWLMA
jgi:hypothetical protein